MYVAAPEPSQQCAGAVRYRSEVQIQFVTLAFSGTSCPAGSQLKCRFFVWRTIKFSAVDHVFCLCRVVLRPCSMFNRCGDAPYSLAVQLGKQMQHVSTVCGESAAWRSVFRRWKNRISKSSKFSSAQDSFDVWKACRQSLSALSAGLRIRAWMDHNLLTLSVRADRTSSGLCGPGLTGSAQGVGDHHELARIVCC